MFFSFWGFNPKVQHISFSRITNAAYVQLLIINYKDNIQLELSLAAQLGTP